MSHSTTVHEFEDGYVFLPCCEDIPSPLTTDECAALRMYWGQQGWPNEICCWAKLHLLNGQMAHSVWYESSVNMKLHQTSCVEVRFSDSRPGV